MKSSIYLDANATTPIDDEVWVEMQPWLREYFHNPSSPYFAGKKARQAIADARAKVAALIGASPEEIFFTSGGTESVNSVLRFLNNVCDKGNFLTSAIEHSAVLKTGASFQRGMQLAKVNSHGETLLDDFSTLSKQAAFTSLMAANNETGVIQPWREAAEISHHYGLPFFCDAIQAAGKIDISDAAKHVDYLVLSAHKFHGAKGAGAVFVKNGMQFTPLLTGGGQENDRRSGTENVAAIVAMGKAAEIALMHLKNGENISSLRDSFETSVLKSISGCISNGSNRLPNTSHLSFQGCEAAGLLILLDDAGVQCSAGSACMSGKQAPSHVQLAMGIEPLIAKSSLRFSFSRMNTPQDAKDAALALEKAVKKLRSVQGEQVGPVQIFTPRK